MVTEFAIDGVFGIAQWFFSLVPDVSWDVNTSAFQYFLDVVHLVSYMVPIGTVAAILTIVLALTALRLMIALGKTIWEFLPI